MQPRRTAWVDSVLLIVLVLAAAAPADAQAPQQIILDTDIGSDIDDAWALGLLTPLPRWT